MYELEWQRFIGETRSDVARYQREWAIAGEPKPSSEFMTQLRRAFNDLDEWHLTAAIYIGTTFDEAHFGRLIPPLLAHSNLYVRLAASRALRRLSSPTAAMLKEAIAFAALAPEDFSPDIEEMSRRVRAH